jgi:hypothetical protein
MNPLVEFVLLNPGLADRLITEHVDDGHGYCRMCALGAQRGYFRIPCDIRLIAEKAKGLEKLRPTTPPRETVRGHRRRRDH